MGVKQFRKWVPVVSGQQVTIGTLGRFLEWLRAHNLDITLKWDDDGLLIQTPLFTAGIYDYVLVDDGAFSVMSADDLERQYDEVY